MQPARDAYLNDAAPSEESAGRVCPSDRCHGLEQRLHAHQALPWRLTSSLRSDLCRSLSSDRCSSSPVVRITDFVTVVVHDAFCVTLFPNLIHEEGSDGKHERRLPKIVHHVDRCARIEQSSRHTRGGLCRRRS